MTPGEHYREADLDIKAAGHANTPGHARFLIARAQVHASLAQFWVLREIGDQLDRLPSALRCDEVDRFGKHCTREMDHEGHHSAGSAA